MDGKFCVECGTKISIDARFCRACGRRQPEITIPSELIGAPKAEAPKEPQADTAAVSAENTEIHTAEETGPERSGEPTPVIQEVQEEAAAPEPKPVPDLQSYLSSDAPKQDSISEIPDEKSKGGIHPAYILLIGCALFVTALLVWAIFITNKMNMTHQSKNTSSSRSIDAVKPAESSSEPATERKKRGGKEEYSGVGGKAADFIESGDYTVGVDIKSGEYIFIADEASLLGDEEEDYIPSFYAGVSEDDDEEHNIHSGWYQCSAYMKLEDGQKLHFSWAKAYPVDAYDGKNDPFSHAGMFRVGSDVDAGTYSIEALTDQGYESYAIFNSIDDVMADDHFTNRNYGLDEDEKVTLTDGQYIQLDWCRLKK